MKKEHFIVLCLCSAFMLGSITNLQAQCVISPGSRYSSDFLIGSSSKFAQNFTATCDGILKQLTINLFYPTTKLTFKSINIGIYKGESPNDPNSKLLYQIENYTLSYTDVVLNIDKKVSIEKEEKYYFIVTNSEVGSDLPKDLIHGYSLNNNNPGGFEYFDATPGSGWQYQQRYVRAPNSYGAAYYGIDMFYKVTITPTINETHSICKGGVFQILHYDSSNSTFKSSDAGGVFDLTVKGDTAVITGLNYGMASFMYTKKDAPNQWYKCEIAAITNIPPSITATKQILSNLTDTITLKAESSNNMAMGFDGNAYLNVPYNGFKFSNGFTFEAWVFCNDVKGQQYLFYKGPDANFNSFGIYIENGKIGFANSANSNTTSFLSYLQINSKRWYHIAVTYDGSKAIFYIDGIQASGVNYTPQIIDNQQDILIGLYKNINSSFPLGYFDNKFKGQMDELRIWNACRTPDEIHNNYKKAILGYSKGLVAYYNFDNTENNNASIDVSINHNNAYINNSKANINSGSVWMPGSVDITKYTYLWSNNATHKNIVVTNPDAYSYKLTDLTTGCTTESQEIQISLQGR